MTQAELTLARFRLSAGDVRRLTAEARPALPKPRYGVPKGVCARKRKYDPRTVLAALAWIEQQAVGRGAVAEAGRRFGVPREILSRYRSGRGREHVAVLKRDAERAGAAEGQFVDANKMVQEGEK